MSFDKTLLEIPNQDLYARCICQKDLKVETIIIGFPGMGLAGAIAAQHISEEMGLETIGFIEGAVIPPVAVFLDGELRHPYRIMGKEGSNVAVFIGESPVSPDAAFYMANAVMDWAEKHGAKEIIALDGFAYLDKNDDSKVYMVAEPGIKQKAEKMKIPPLRSGYIQGFAGAILNKTMISKLEGYAFLVGTRPDLPDPGAAAALIKTVNIYKKIDVDFQSLLEQSESIKRKLQELASQTQEVAQPRPESKKRTFYT
ncbi:MAG: proteasome assembly chaperone family protein [Candidatus Thorarchaeota archaeon]